MKLRPLHDHIIVERLEEESKTAGGILIPETAKEKPQYGKIIAVGSGKRTDNGKIVPLDLKVDDKVLFAKYAGNEIKSGDEHYLILRENDILGVME